MLLGVETHDPQAAVLYPIRDSRSTSHDQFPDRVYHILGSLSFRGFGGPSNASPRLGIDCHGMLQETGKTVRWMIAKGPNRLSLCSTI